MARATNQTQLKRMAKRMGYEVADEIVSIPLKDLVNDVPVEPDHVDELVESMKRWGQLEAVTVREGTLEIINGFHRVAALQKLSDMEFEGLEGFDCNYVKCVIKPCESDDEFYSQRVVSAVTHDLVKCPRATDWILKSFELASFEGKSDYSTAYSLFLSYRRQRGESPAQAGLDDLSPAHLWAKEHCDAWNLKAHTIEEYLYTEQSLESSVYKKTSLAKISLDDQSPMTYTAGRQLGKVLPLNKEYPNRADWHKRITKKAESEGLSAVSVEKLARDIRKVENNLEAVEEILASPVITSIKKPSKRSSIPGEQQHADWGEAWELKHAFDNVRIHSKGDYFQRVNEGTKIALITLAARGMVDILDLLARLSLDVSDSSKLDLLRFYLAFLVGVRDEADQLAIPLGRLVPDAPDFDTAKKLLDALAAGTI